MAWVGACGDGRDIVKANTIGIPGRNDSQNVGRNEKWKL